MRPLMDRWSKYDAFGAAHVDAVDARHALSQLPSALQSAHAPRRFALPAQSNAAPLTTRERIALTDASKPRNAVMMGATGAVGGEVVRALLGDASLETLTLLGRRSVAEVQDERVQQHHVDIFSAESYADHLAGHEIAICTLGVGEPSKISKEEFLKIDKYAVLEFANACAKAGIKRFAPLSSVGASATSRTFYLRSKGELEEELQQLGFEQVSLFRPSMILTPTNRYGVMQAITLKVWPVLSTLFFGSLRKLRGIKVRDLGSAIARKSLSGDHGNEILYWPEIVALSK